MSAGKRLSRAYYIDDEVTGIARDLLGKVLVTNFDGHLCSGMVVETEAYRAPEDQACHAFNNRRTPRTEVMFEKGGVAYIYLCYGVYHLMNVVTGPKDHAHAVLIRALEPIQGMDIMALRRQLPPTDVRLTKGPGVLSIAMGLKSSFSGTSLIASDSPIWIEDRSIGLTSKEIGVSERIGVESAGLSASWPWRYFIKGNKYVSAHQRCI